MLSVDLYYLTVLLFHRILVLIALLQLMHFILPECLVNVILKGAVEARVIIDKLCFA